MNIDVYNLNDLMYFLQVVEYGGFLVVECVLGILKLCLLWCLIELEVVFGVCLLQCLMCKFVLIEVGELFYQYCQVMFVEVQVVMNVVQQLCVLLCGLVCVSVLVMLLQMMLLCILFEFLCCYFEVKVYVCVMNCVIDLFEDLIDVVLCVCLELLQNVNIVVWLLWCIEQMLVGVLSLLSQNVLLLVLDDLIGFEMFDMLSVDGWYVFNLIVLDGMCYVYEYDLWFVMVDLMMICEVVFDGFGIVVLLEMMYGNVLCVG